MILFDKKEKHINSVSSRKSFKDKEKFIKLVIEFQVHKSTIIFKINIFTLIDKHPKLMKSSMTLDLKKKTIARVLSKFVKKIQTSLNR